MSWKLKNLTAKNFLSIGAVSQSISFEQTSLVLVLGENLDMGGEDSGSKNGTGKTSIINALSYALYGKSISNIGKENLINKTNGKAMLVTIEFEKDGKTYKIERGRKPTFLKFFVNNIEQEEKGKDSDSQGDSRETQQDIERILGMSHDMFKNIVALNTYTEPFLNLPVNGQRIIIEQLLGITLLSEKAEVLKNELKTNKDVLNSESIRLQTIQESNNRIQKQIEGLITKQKLWDKSQSTDISSFLEALSTLNEVNIAAELENHKELVNYNGLNKQISDLTQEAIRVETQLFKDQKLHTKLLNELTKIKEGTCHACGQELCDDNHQAILADKTAQEHAVSVQINQFKVELTSISEKIKFLGKLPEIKPEVFYAEIQDAYDHKNQIAMIEQQLLQRQIDQNPYTDQIADMQNKALQEVSYEKINEFTKLQEHQEFLLKLLTSKDSFIRKKIIDQNLSYLNSRLSFYLGKIGLPHKVLFQSDLSVSITELDRDLDFQNLSRGEMSRLSLSLSWAFRDTYESLYDKIDLLFIDETLDSGIDPAGLENAMAILKEMNRHTNRNIWIISHREELISRVTNVFKVTKSGGFTTFGND